MDSHEPWKINPSSFWLWFMRIHEGSTVICIDKFVNRSRITENCLRITKLLENHPKIAQESFKNCSRITEDHSQMTWESVEKHQKSLENHLKIVYLDTLDTLSFFSDRQHWNLQRSLTQLVSTSNKRSSSGEMKKDLKRVGIYMGVDWTLVFDQRWTVKGNLHTLLVVDWSVISVMCGVWKAVVIKPDTCEHVTTLIHTFWGVWRWKNDTTQFMSGVKELALFENMWQTTQSIWVDQLNRFLILYVSNVSKYTFKSSRWTFSIMKIFWESFLLLENHT